MVLTVDSTTNNQLHQAMETNTAPNKLTRREKKK